MDSTSLFLQFILGGLTLGSIYGITALGISLIYRVSTVINFAQGEFLMLGAFVAIWLITFLPIPVAFVIAVATVAIAGILAQRLCIAPITKSPHLILIMVTMALSTILKGAAMLVWGKDPLSLPSFLGNSPVMLLGASITPQALLVLLTIVVVAIFFTYFFKHTKVGIAMRACAENRDVASLIGINAVMMDGITFGLSAALGAIGGILIAPIVTFSYEDGTIIGMKGLVAAILGGMSSTPGALVGGLTLGILEAVSAGVISSQYKDATAFLVLILVLVLRPNGILGKDNR